jgi:hypothetical protein
MRQRISPYCWTVFLLFTVLAVIEASAVNAAPEWYWCPSRIGNELQTMPEPGCQPLIEREQKREEGKKPKRARSPIKADNPDAAVATFMQEYRQFLACCANNPDSLDDVEDLEDQASELLKQLTKTFGNDTLRQKTLAGRGLIMSIVQARTQLQNLKKQLVPMGESLDKLNALDYESAGRERRKIQEQEQAIGRQFRPGIPPSRAATGAEIGNSTLPSSFGNQIGNTTLPTITGPGFGSDPTTLKPRPGMEAEATTLPNRIGDPSGSAGPPKSTLPTATGAAVGTNEGPTGTSTLPSRSGASIGDSSQNSR